MEMTLLWTFIGLNILNVIIQTIKSIATVKCGKGWAALISAVAYGLYTVVTVYMMCNLPLAWKAIIVAVCNLVGVYVVKWGEEKARKDKLWKIEATVYPDKKEFVDSRLKEYGLPFNYIDVDKYVIFNIYCATQLESSMAHCLLDVIGAKYFVSESKKL